MAKLFISLFLAATAMLGITLASTFPTNELHITPHPDLPSLESLGVTPAQLYDMAVNLTTNLQQGNPPEPQPASLAPRTNTYTDHCDGKMCWPAGLFATVGCVAYLQLSNKQFHVDGNFTVLCEGAPGTPDEPRALIMGYAIVTDFTEQFWPVASSAAVDIGVGAERILQKCYGCKDGKCGVSGTAAANGNGDFLVWIASEVNVEGRCE